MRQPGARLVHQADGELLVRDAYVDVEPENNLCTDGVLLLFHQLKIALALGDLLVQPGGDRMCPGAQQGHALLPGYLCQKGALAIELSAHVGNSWTDRRDQLDRRLNQLGLDALSEQRSSFF